MQPLLDQRLPLLQLLQALVTHLVLLLGSTVLLRLQQMQSSCRCTSVMAAVVAGPVVQGCVETLRAQRPIFAACIMVACGFRCIQAHDHF